MQRINHGGTNRIAVFKIYFCLQFTS